MGGFFFLNKNKPKGLLGIVVPAASLASPAPEEYGCMKGLDHTSRRAPRLAFPLSPPSLGLSELVKEERLADIRGRLGGVSRGAGMGWGPDAFWEAMLGRGGGWAPPVTFNPFGTFRHTGAGRVRVGIES